MILWTALAAGHLAVMWWANHLGVLDQVVRGMIP